MRNLYRWVMCFLVGASGFSAEIFAGKPREIDAPVEKVFVPKGFDDNDDSEVIVHGHFTNDCYQVGSIKASVVDGVVMLRAKALYQDKVRCHAMVVPYIQPVKLGVLDEGDYLINVNGKTDLAVNKLHVKVADKKGVRDDFLYAPVKSASVSKVNGKDFLTIEGKYPLFFIGCMKIKKHVRNYMSAGNVLVVQPTAEIKEGDECANQPPTFSITTQLDENLPKGESLIHIRVLSGNSYNELYEKVE